jgi:hypothetical protein
MALPVVVQAPNAVFVSGAASGQITFGGSTTAGNALVGGVVMNSSATRTWTVTDTVDAGNWPSELLYQPARSMQIHARHGITAGTPTVTWTISSATFNGWIWAAEVSGLDPLASPVTGTLDESPTTSASHNCAGSAVVAADAFVIGVGTLTSTATATAAGASYALAPTLSSNQMIIQYKVAASQNDTGPWSNTGTQRVGQACMAAFPGLSFSAASFPHVPAALLSRRRDEVVGY